MADAMLGRLARWLRILGFDTLYYGDISDGDLLKHALGEDRIILTRDSHFLAMRNLGAFYFVRSEDTAEQLREVLAAYRLREFARGRCARCNGTLDIVMDKRRIADEVPEHVFLKIDSFQRCRACGKIYWEGTHLKRFRRMLSGIVSEQR